MPKTSIAEKKEAENSANLETIDTVLTMQHSVLLQCLGATKMKYAVHEDAAGELVDIETQLQAAIKVATAMRTGGESITQSASRKRKIAAILPAYERLAKTVHLSGQLLELLKEDDISVKHGAAISNPKI